MQPLGFGTNPNAQILILTQNKGVGRHAKHIAKAFE